MKKVKIRKGYFGVIERDGKTIAVKEAVNAFIVEAPDNVTITEKTKSKLTAAEKDKLK